MDRMALQRLFRPTLPSTLLGLPGDHGPCQLPLKPQQLRENNILTVRIQAVLDGEHRKPFLSVATWKDHCHWAGSWPWNLPGRI